MLKHSVFFSLVMILCDTIVVGKRKGGGILAGICDQNRGNLAFMGVTGFSCALSCHG